MEGWGKDGQIRQYSKGERRKEREREGGREGERERGRGRERESERTRRKPPRSRATTPSLKTPSAHASAPPLAALVFTYPPELHLRLEHTVPIKHDVDVQLRAKNDRGSHNPRSQAVTTTHNQAGAMSPTSTGQPGNPDRARGQWCLHAEGPDAAHLGLTGLHPVERRQWDLPIHSHHHQGLCLVPIVTARCWQLKRRWEKWVER